MTTVSINFKANQVYAYLRDVPQGVRRATSRAMNSMGPVIRQESTDRIVGIYNMRASDAKKGIKLVSRSGPNRLRVVWSAKGGPIPLKSYGAQLIGGGRKGKGRNNPVSVEVFKQRRKVVRGGFVGPNGHVFKRVGKARLPIRKLFGPSLPSGFVKDAVIAAQIRTTNDVLPGRIQSEMVRELRRLETGKLPSLS